ncbi:uncharacterized protein UMAG_10853 [Mycosarcoma maydis]|uniref:Uncharacterized protein n=1 Tax=Mycosarcoma maydis TaxID=5270 RepID=A0A0D1DW79_MYCMD|nr:uncharacterized protein UMAG_10853 [Ustilago maydis 521]KIS66795.1 hypothetical protein UMAG_10853 [Ustilago maydis 521]|eukprot:XP_011391761.1 hypothetical protein UMAG_10853 [Ustilago maydis 521]
MSAYYGASVPTPAIEHLEQNKGTNAHISTQLSKAQPRLPGCEWALSSAPRHAQQSRIWLLLCFCWTRVKADYLCLCKNPSGWCHRASRPHFKSHHTTETRSS